MRYYAHLICISLHWVSHSVKAQTSYNVFVTLKLESVGLFFFVKVKVHVFVYLRRTITFNAFGCKSRYKRGWNWVEVWQNTLWVRKVWRSLKIWSFYVCRDRIRVVQEWSEMYKVFVTRAQRLVLFNKAIVLCCSPQHYPSYCLRALPKFSSRWTFLQSSWWSKGHFF